MAKTNYKYECPACGKMHYANRLSKTNWWGNRADPGEVWAIGWCEDAGRETGERIQSPMPATN